MLLSMTGFGEGKLQTDAVTVAVEIRTVNNRYLKISIRCPDAFAELEGDIEKIVREKISRGTVHVDIRVTHAVSIDESPLNELMIESYVTRLRAVANKLGLEHRPDLNVLVSLPGVVTDESHRQYNVEAEWPFLRDALTQALAKLQKFRCDEGDSMRAELVLNNRVIDHQLQEVIRLAPQVVAEFRVKTLDRVRQLLADAGGAVTETDLIREVSIYADKTDINEEIKRLTCHLGQFQTFIDEKDSPGRKLDFLSQEMFREINTIGSKANNVAIAHCVVEMKAAVEKIREILQNVE